MEKSKILFPAKEYSTIQNQWIGKECIVTPSIKNILLSDNLIRDKNIIDIGCGNGHYSSDMLKWGAQKVHGIDQSLLMINEARNSYNENNLTFECLSTLDMSYENIFDIAVGFFVLEFNETVDDLYKTFKNIYKCLNIKNGKFIGIIPNGIDNFNPTKNEGIKFGASWEINTSVKRYDGERLKVNFYNNNGIVIGNAPVTFFFQNTYIKAAIEAGFKKIEFKEMIVSKEGLEKYGYEYFESYLSPPKNFFIIASC